MMRQPQRNIDDIIVRLEAIEKQKADERIESIKKRLRTLTFKLARQNVRLKSVISVLSLFIAIFATISGFLGFRLNEYRKFEASRADLNQLLVKQLLTRTEEVVNKLFALVVASELNDRIDDLSNTQKQLAGFDIQGDTFEETSKLIEALYVYFKVQNRDKAKEILHDLRGAKDKHVLSRALAVNAMLEISKNRAEIRPLLEFELNQAIKLDGTNALAFVCLGILKANRAADIFRHLVGPADLPEATNLLKDAGITFEIAGGLDSSKYGSYRRVNNRICCDLYLIAGYLDAKQPDGEILKHIHYESMNAFFQAASATLEAYSRLVDDIPLAIESVAELKCVEAQYRRLNEPDKAKGLLEEATARLKEAIKKGLYRKIDDSEEAKKSFREAYLNKEIANNPEYMKDIEDAIDKDLGGARSESDSLKQP